MTQQGFLIFSAAIATALSVIYVFWPQSSTKPKTRRGVILGLYNLGNSCFLNAIIQAIASCNNVVQWLGSIVSQHQQNQRDVPLAEAVLRVLKVLNNQLICEDQTFSAAEVISELRSKNWVISSDEQDAHEMFHVLMSTLEEEVKSPKNVRSLLDVSGLEDSSASLITASPAVPRSSVDDNLPFHGLLASQLRCKSCGYKCPIKFDTFDSLSLTIPSGLLNVMSLETCLRHFASSELVQNVECTNCSQQQLLSACSLSGDQQAATTSNIQPPPTSSSSQQNTGTKSTFVKQLNVGKLPRTLCIHLQRTVWLSNGVPVKRFDYVSFPEFLSLDEFVYNQKELSLTDGGGKLVGGNNIAAARLQSHSLIQPGSLSSYVAQSQILSSSSARADFTPSSHHLYQLQSVIVHLGDVNSGHFVTYRRFDESPRPPSAGSEQRPRPASRWFYTSDLHVREVSLAEVLKTDAYLLFYEKVRT